VRRAVVAALLVATVGACGPERDVPIRAARFASLDGVELRGDVRGGGGAGVVLAHMFPEDRTSWGDFAGSLAAEGFHVLAFDFRGFGDSGGARDLSALWRDVAGAADELRRRGARRVVLVGASMGGTAALVAASQEQFDGVVTLSAPSTFMGIAAPPEVVAAVDEPKLFLAAQGDGQAAATAQTFYTMAPGAKRLEIVTGDDHGSDLLDGNQGQIVRMHIVSFLHAHAEP
jgi:uncharacterized protein